MSAGAGTNGNGAGSAWTSIHLHHEGGVYGPESDRVILRLAVPLARHLMGAGLCERYFFVRYGERGAHVRLRLLGAPDVVADAFHECYPTVLASSSVEEVVGRIEARPAVYEPETTRYRGPYGLEAAERFFHASSEAAVGLLDGGDALDQATRSGRVLLAMTVLLRALVVGARRAERFVENYRRGYLHAYLRDEGRIAAWHEVFDEAFERQEVAFRPYVAEAWRRVVGLGEDLPCGLGGYLEGLYRLRSRLETLLSEGRLEDPRGGGPLTNWPTAVATLVPSYLHMMNNRLGVATHEESYLAHLLARALERVADAEGPHPCEEAVR